MILTLHDCLEETGDVVTQEAKDLRIQESLSVYSLAPSSDFLEVGPIPGTHPLDPDLQVKS